MILSKSRRMTKQTKIKQTIIEAQRWANTISSEDKQSDTDNMGERAVLGEPHENERSVNNNEHPDQTPICCSFVLPSTSISHRCLSYKLCH